MKDNGIGTAGVAPGTRILPVFTPPYYAGGDEALAVERAVARGARVVLVTRPNPHDQAAFRAAVEHAVALGRVVVAPAGDAGTTNPQSWDTSVACRIASAAGGICVGASSPADEHKSVASCDGEALWSSAFAGPGPDVVAPGVGGCTTDRAGDRGYGRGDPWEEGLSSSATCRASGTAFAAARVAGVVALMLTASPGLSPAQVREILAATARDIDAPGADDRTGAGRVDAAAAVRAAARTAGDQRPIPLLEAIEPTRARAGDPGLLLTLRGTGFVPESVAIWNGEPRPTLFVSSQELHAEIGADDLADQRRLRVGVATPPPEEGPPTSRSPSTSRGTRRRSSRSRPTDRTASRSDGRQRSRVRRRLPPVGRGRLPVRLRRRAALRLDSREHRGAGGPEPSERRRALARGGCRRAAPGCRAAAAGVARTGHAAGHRRAGRAGEHRSLRLRRVASATLRALPLAALTVDEAGLLGLAGDAPVRRIWRDELRRAKPAGERSGDGRSAGLEPGRDRPGAGDRGAGHGRRRDASDAGRTRHGGGLLLFDR